MDAITSSLKSCQFKITSGVIFDDKDLTTTDPVYDFKFNPHEIFIKLLDAELHPTSCAYELTHINKIIVMEPTDGICADLEIYSSGWTGIWGMLPQPLLRLIASDCNRKFIGAMERDPKIACSRMSTFNTKSYSKWTVMRYLPKHGAGLIFTSLQRDATYDGTYIGCGTLVLLAQSRSKLGILLFMFRSILDLEKAKALDLIWTRQGKIQPSAYALPPQLSAFSID